MVPKYRVEMAQVAQRHTSRLGNTRTSRLRKRNWCFTLNNYIPEEIKALEDGKYEYVFQEETGSNGTPHLQGVLFFKNPQALSAMKKINSRAHWEPMKGNRNQAIAYCTKEDTRTGEIYTNINIENVAQGTEKKLRKKFVPSEEILEQEKKKLIEKIKGDVNEDDWKKYTMGGCLAFPYIK